MSVLSNAAVIGGSAAGYQIANSLRFRASASAYLSRTFGAGNRRLWSYGGWLKCGNVSGATQMELLSVRSADSDAGYLTFKFNTDRTLYVDGFSTSWRRTTQVFRDPTAHFHFWLIWDSENATANDRIRLYVNGVRVTSFSTTNNPSTGTDYAGNQASEHNIGRNIRNANAFLDGLLSDVYFIGGVAVEPMGSVVETNSDNVLVPKAYSGSYSGTNSCYLPFNDATSTTTLGYDRSGNGNNWTCNNISLTAGVTYDHMVDTPTNNFPVWNAINNKGGMTLSDANLKATSSASSRSIISTMPIPTSGVYWVEQTIGAYATNGSVGVCKESGFLGNGSESAFLAYIGVNGNKNVNGSNTAYGSTYTTSDVIGYLIDVDSSTVTFYKQTGGTGNFVSQGAISYTTNTGDYFIYAYVYNGNHSLNSGQRTFNYVTQHGALPANAVALCTANLPQVAISNPSNGFKVTLATEDNIYTQVASARTGWTDYVDILKNRAATESWAWQFSHDSSNEYAVQTSSLVRQSKRAMSGSNNWVGYSIRIGATYGTAAGSVSHTSGSVTTVTHNVGKSARQMILLFNRAGGSAIPVYHPDCATGELLDLCTTAADAASTAITGVLSNSFQIGSGVTTGIYDYLVIQEQSGFFALWKYTGNGSSDGPFSSTDMLMGLWISKGIGTTTHWTAYDSDRSPYNEVIAELALNLPNAEGTISGGGDKVDFTAGGIKYRGVVTNDLNISGQIYVNSGFAIAPFGAENTAPAPAR